MDSVYRVTGYFSCFLLQYPELKMKIFSIILGFTTVLLSVFLTGCNEHKEDPAYIKSLQQWHSRRIENLKKENGWLNLAGLYWLEEGDNSIGSATDNKIVFPEAAPPKIGVINLNRGVLKFQSAYDIKVKIDSSETKTALLKDDMSGNPTVMQLNNFRWIVIKRGDRYGIRLRDLNSSVIKSFTGVDMYDINSSWKVTARFIKYSDPKVISVPNILGSTEEDTVKGELKFKLDNQDFTLVPISEGDELFIIFADETNGEETYGAGRFLYAAAADSDGKVILDFNKAYNPPCAFTKYATCPLPPKENYLHIKIKAGEKKYGDH